MSRVSFDKQLGLDQIQQAARRACPGQNIGLDSEESQAPLRRKHVQLDSRRTGTFKSHLVQRQFAEAVRRSETLRGHVPGVSRGISSSLILIKLVLFVTLFAFQLAAHPTTAPFLLRSLANIQRYNCTN